MRWIKRKLGLEKPEHDQSIKAHWHNRINHVGRKMSKGASNIFRVIKDHAKWGSKPFGGSKGHHKPGKPPKH